jgi:hypothetical protein
MSEKTSKTYDYKKMLALFAVCIYTLSIILASSFAPASAVPPSQPDLFEIVDWTLGNVTEVQDTLKNITEMQSKMEKFDVVAATDEYFAEPGGFDTVSVFVDVTCNGEGVADLDDENFEAVALRFPLGSYMPRIEDVEKFPVTPGSYWIHMRPKLGDTWREGLYIWDLLVTDGNRTGSTIFTVTVLEGNQVSWMNDVKSGIEGIDGKVDDVHTYIDERIDAVEERLDNQPKLFNKRMNITYPFHPLEADYRIWVNSTENYVVKAVYFGVDYGEDYLFNPVKIEFLSSNGTNYGVSVLIPETIPESVPIGVQSSSFSIDSNYWVYPRWNASNRRGWKVELLSQLGIKTPPTCPANSTFQIRFDIPIEGVTWDEILYLHVMVESTANAIVDMGYAKGYYS